MKVAYTFNKTNDSLFTLYSSLNNSTIEVAPNHPKWAWMQSLSADRIINISTKGAWNSSKDYKGLYSAKPVASKPLAIKLTKLNDLKFSDDLFVAMKTNTAVDAFLSTEGGFLPGTNIMAAGGAGVGKTTILLELLYKIQEADPARKVLFISAEMNQLDMARYLKRFPHWGSLPILFLSDYTDGDSKAAIEQTLQEGWDIVLTDSYTEVNDTIKEESGMSRGKTEKWFLTLMTEHNMANNQSKRYTTFITILQLSKGGVFVGSSKLKHMTTAMMHLDWKGGENSAERYMEFSKNRLGQVGHKLFFNFENGITFDEIRYKRDLLNQEMIQEEKQKLKTEEDAFDKLFGSLPTEAETVEAVMVA